MRRPLLIAVVPVAAAAVLAAGCGGDSSAELAATTPAAPAAPSQPAAAASSEAPKPWRTFAKQELRRIALQPKDAPSDLVYVRGESGGQTLASMGLVLPRQQKTVRSFGFVAAHDAVFVAKRRASDRRVTERVWLFKKPSGAKRWLERTRRDAADLEFESLDAPLLGEESWAARGLIQIGGGRAVTHAFRLGNAVFTVLMYGDVTPPSESGALAAAKAALVRAKSVRPPASK